MLKTTTHGFKYKSFDIAQYQEKLFFILNILFFFLCLVFALDLGGEFGLRNKAVLFLIPVMFVLNKFKFPKIAVWTFPVLVAYPILLMIIAVYVNADISIAFTQLKGTLFGWALLIVTCTLPAQRILYSLSIALTIAAGIIILLFTGAWIKLPVVLQAIKYLSICTPSLIGEGKVLGDGIVPAIYLKSTLFMIPVCIFWLFNKRVFFALVCFLGLIASISKTGFVLGIIAFTIFFLLEHGNRDKFLILLGLLIGLAVAGYLGYFDIFISKSSNIQTLSNSSTLLIRKGHFSSFIEYFIHYPLNFFFGFGLGQPIYSMGSNAFVFNTELDHFNLIWKYGFIWSSIFSLFIFKLSVKSIISVEKRLRIFGIVSLVSFFVAGTNPVLITPIFFLILSALNNSFLMQND